MGINPFLYQSKEWILFFITLSTISIIVHAESYAIVKSKTNIHICMNNALYSSFIFCYMQLFIVIYISNLSSISAYHAIIYWYNIYIYIYNIASPYLPATYPCPINTVNIHISALKPRSAYNSMFVHNPNLHTIEIKICLQLYICMHFNSKIYLQAYPCIHISI